LFETILVIISIKIKLKLISKNRQEPTFMSNGLLRLISSNGATIQTYSLSNDEIYIGREPSSCAILLDSNAYGMVSRRHASIRQERQHGRIIYTLCDLNSSGGTFLNSQRLQGCQELRDSDKIQLSEDGPEFIFEYQVAVTNIISTSENSTSNQTSNTGASAFFPIGSKEVRRQLFNKGFLLPGIITVIFVVSLFVVRGYGYQLLLGTYLGCAALFFTYQLCGKSKPWWVITGSATICVLTLVTVYFWIIAPIFYKILPGRLSDSQSLIPALIGNFVGPGLSEELTKALPIFIFHFIGRRIASPGRERIGVEEPLDGILIGSASATGFTLYETLVGYVPQQIMQVGQQLGVSSGELAGLQLLIPRILGEIAGHMAWSGWFGYCIGLSILRPNKRWQILSVGYFSAALLHGFWNSAGALSQIIGILVFGWWILIGGFSYALFVGAILKARTISPTRSSNFATRFFGKN
jgi:RsiW-degrading membrane proteinase PrsW (M82 family)